MLFIRPAHPDDLDALADLADAAGVGITTLPKDRELLSRRILKSQRSIERIPDRPGGESYLFAMQDAESRRIVGACGIVSKVGGFEPFYAFRLRSEVHACATLNVRTEVPYLQLVREHDGPCEIGSLFLHPDYRGKGNGRLLQLVRFLFIAEHPMAFESTVVSELRGVIDDESHSPFWDAVGRHFFDIDFRQADHLSVVNKKFIAHLMPVHPIYIPLLPQSAQAVIGQVHESTRPAWRNLESEGFHASRMVDIFDAGPCVTCSRDEIRTVRESRTAVVREIVDGSIESIPFAISSRNLEFRAVVGPLEVENDAVRLTREVAGVLGVEVGDVVRFVSLRPASDAVGASNRSGDVTEGLA